MPRLWGRRPVIETIEVEITTEQKKKEKTTTPLLVLFHPPHFTTASGKVREPYGFSRITRVRTPDPNKPDGQHTPMVSSDTITGLGAQPKPTETTT